MENKILVVDDERPIAEIIKFYLKREGYDVICAYDGQQAIDLVDQEYPDMIILDVMLPVKGGMEVCHEVRQTHTMPIIMLSANDSEFDKACGLEQGADDYVTKPFGNRELMARVKANLRRYKRKQIKKMAN